MIAPTACVPKRTTTNPSSPTAADADRITALEAKVSQLQSKIASLPASSGNYDKAIAALEADIDSIRDELDNTLVEIDAMLADFEEEQQVAQEEKETATNVKWSRDVTSNYPETDVIVDYWQTPSRMESEGDYTIKVTVTNIKKDTGGNPVAISDLILDITYTPSGTVYVDSKDTFLDTISSPYTLWDTDIVTRTSDGYCRRISNMSEKIKLGAGEALQLKLEFILTYK